MITIEIAHPPQNKRRIRVPHHTGEHVVPIVIPRDLCLTAQFRGIGGADPAALTRPISAPISRRERCRRAAALGAGPGI